ncbi:MAG: ATP-binding cassette domain-containing protein [Phaeodactylibacter sp.]|nr:ATP-binding cassette domain-containing protein [Phaeodactylibacter sp.]
MSLFLHDVSLSYPKGPKALDRLSLRIEPGMFGLLGPNGAGKSSLMRVLATLQQPDSGQVRFEDLDLLREPLKIRGLLGYLPQEFGVYPRISAEKLLDYFAVLKGLSGRKERRRRIEEVLMLTNLYTHRKAPVYRFSGGMKRRFGIAQLLLNRPRLIIVDEPTAGLDPGERSRFLHVLRALGTQHTVLFSTHIVEDIRDLCTDMAILYQGQLALHETPTRALTALNGKIWSGPAHLKLSLPHRILSSTFDEGHRERVRLHADTSPGDLFQPATPTLEDVYFLTLQLQAHVESPVSF